MFQRKLKFLLLVGICTSIKAEEIPNCDYFDTVDLTGIEKLSNGSYNYEGVMIPPEQTGTYNYKILFEGTNITVENHLRGCVCKMKPCIRYCCQRHRLDLADETNCSDEFKNHTEYITLADGSKQERSIRHQFVVQPGEKVLCSDNFQLVRFFINEDWKLFENGTLHRSKDDVYLSNRDYCLQSKELLSLGFSCRLWHQNYLNELHYDKSFYVKWTSTLFLLLTTFIYIFVIKQQQAYDKCCLCYLICFLVHLLINRLIDIDEFLLGLPCSIVAYLNYFSTISSYLWLTVMSFEFNRIFVGDMFVTIQHNNQLRFLKYNLFVWGIASGLLLIIILTDHLLDNLDIEANWKVGCAYFNCIFKCNDWSIFIYLLGPATLMILIKAIFMISTICHVHIENRKIRKQFEELGQPYIKNNVMFTFYLRFLTTEILNWITELCYVLYFTPIKMTNYLLGIVTYFNLIYFILIFAITITRRDVRQLFACRTPVSY